MGPLPFNDFLAHLRRQGFPVGVDHHLRLQTLLDRLGPSCAPEDLKTILCPIFASSAAQQATFYQAFDAWYGLLRPTLEPAPEQPAAPRPAARRWPYVVAAAVLLIALIAS